MTTWAFHSRTLTVSSVRNFPPWTARLLFAQCKSYQQQDRATAQHLASNAHDAAHPAGRPLCSLPRRCKTWMIKGIYLIQL